MTGITERADARLNRERILDAAAEIFAEKGLATEVKEIADRAGVGIGTIYRNFPTKDDLIAAIITSMLDGTRSVLAEAVDEDDPAEAVSNYIRSIVAVMPRFTPIVMAMLSGSVSPGLKGQMLDMMLDEQLKSLVVRGIESGVFREDLDPDLAAAFIANTFHPMVYLALEGKLDAPAMAEGYIDLVLRALRG